MMKEKVVCRAQLMCSSKGDGDATRASDAAWGGTKFGLGEARGVREETE